MGIASNDIVCYTSAAGIVGAMHTAGPAVTRSSPIRWLLVVGWAAFLFLLSAQPGLAISDRPDLDWVLRKSAHVVVYAVLAVLVARALTLTDVRRRAVLAALLAAMYAVTDEYHQTLVASRSGALGDVGVDAAGAVLGALAWWFWERAVPDDVPLAAGDVDIRTEIEVRAPVAAVWALIADSGGWAAWNPHQHVDGEFREGERVSVTSRPPGGPSVRIRPRVTRLAPGRELAWVGWWLHPRLFAGEHRFILEPLGSEATRFVQAERFTGLLLPLYARMRLASTRAGFVAMNEALKRRAEAPAGAAPR